MRLNWFSAPPKKQSAGVLSRLIGRVAPTWRHCPVRRIVQTVCLLAFLVLFLYVCFPYTAVPAQQRAGWVPSETGAEAWPSHYADDILRKEVVPAELFLAIDPLVSLSTAVATRTWVWSLTFAGVILLVCLVVPRGFCGYVCPLGTAIDLFDWMIGRRLRRLNVSGRGWYVHLKYYLLAGVLVSAVFGVLVSGFVAAIPILTRAAAYLLTPLETAVARSWHQIPAINAGQTLSLVLFVAVLGLGFLKPRFWCRHVCPSGALFSIANVLRLTERKVEHSCIKCGKCVEACPFDAIEPDFTTRTTDCAFCQTCGGACPVTAIQFVQRWQTLEEKTVDDRPTDDTPLVVGHTKGDAKGDELGGWSKAQRCPSPHGLGLRYAQPPATHHFGCDRLLGRRGFLTAGIGLATGAIGGVAAAKLIAATGARLGDAASCYPVRPPGSVPEEAFLRMCIRCGECLQACPNDVLQPQAFQQGVEGLWTPRVVANWSGCEPSCNNCCQVCPTGAIRAIPLQEKRVARMGLALVNERTCLPYAGREECQLCVDECETSGYDAIEFRTVGTETDDLGAPIEGTGMLAPVVLAEKCVGCGLCQTRCHAINVKTKHLLSESAVLILAGPGKEDRITSGSYLALRAAEKRQREAAREEQAESQSDSGSYLPDFLK